jgi:hypothetical protein
MSAPASAASAAATIPTPASKGDRVLSIVDDLNSKFTQWLSLRHKRKRTTTTAELLLEADVMGLSEEDRARLRHLLTCHGFDVVPGISGIGGGKESIVLFRGAAPTSSKHDDDDDGDENAKEEDDAKTERKKKEKSTECSKCQARATPDFVRLPRCAHIFCPKCTRYMTLSPDCQCCESCTACYKKFFFEDMEYLDGTSYEASEPPSKRHKTTDQATAAAAAASE